MAQSGRASVAVGAVLLVLIASTAQSQQLPSQGAEKDPADKQIHETVDKDKIPEATIEVPTVSPSVLLKTVPEDTQEQRQEKIKQNDWSEKIIQRYYIVTAFLSERWYELAITVFTFLLAVFTCLLAMFTRKLVRATSDLKEIAKDQHTAMQGQYRAMMDSVAVARTNAAAAEKAAKVAEDTLTATQRPWITVEVHIRGRLAYTDDKLYLVLPLRFVLKNVGHSPAFHVSVEVRTKVPAIGVDLGETPQSLQRKVFEELKSYRPDPYGYSIFPGTYITVDKPAWVHRNDIVRATQKKRNILLLCLWAEPDIHFILETLAFT